MTCTNCGGSMVTNRETRPYDWSGLDNVILVDVEVRRCVACKDDEVVIPRIADLHRVLAGAVAAKSGRLTAGEVRFLRKSLGWSGTDFARHMGVEPETVSRWEHGKKVMGPTAERLLRLYVVHFAPVEEYPVERLAEVPIENGEHAERYCVSTSPSGWKVAA